MTSDTLTAPTYPNERYCADLESTWWRAEFAHAWCNDPDRRFFMLEWARRHRKTSDAVTMLIRDCMLHKDWVSLVVAPFRVQAQEILWDDPKMLFSILPDQELCGWESNKSDLSIKFPGGSIFRLTGGDKLEGRRGIDCNDLLLTEFAYAKPTLWTEIFMPIMAGRSEIPRRVIFDYTPRGDNHATQLFDWASCQSDPGQELPTRGRAAKLLDLWWCSRVINDETRFLDPVFLDECRDKWPRAIYDQEINCARVTAEEMTLITTEMLHELNNRVGDIPVLETDEVRKIVSIDPAFGGDVCEIMGMNNCRIVEQQDIRAKHKTAEIVMAGKVVARKLGTKNFIVDCIGNGLGVADGLSSDEAGYHVQYFNSSESPTPDSLAEELQCANRRAEAYWYTAQEIQACRVGAVTSQRLRTGLPTASRYTVRGNGRLLIEPKVKIKQWLGRSPDDEDCYVMGVWGTQRVRPQNARTTLHLDRHSAPPGAMA